jgi:hypothetical protein
MAIHETVARVLGEQCDAASQLGLDVAPAEDEKAFVEWLARQAGR